jgi:hypothetical protein
MQLKDPSKDRIKPIPDISSPLAFLMGSLPLQIIAPLAAGFLVGFSLPRAYGTA